MEGRKEIIRSKKGFDFISAHYDCDKVILLDAVQPIVTEEQVSYYFKILDTFDHVVTCRKVTSSLGRYDNVPVKRDEFFHTNAPERFRFSVIAPIFDADYPSEAVEHQLPKGSSSYKCFDYPYNMKITYFLDLKIADVMLNEYIRKPKQAKVLKKAESWLSSVNCEETMRWFKVVPDYFEILRKRWEISSYTMNPQSFTSIVYECCSGRFGNVVVKFNAPFLGRYIGERYYYQAAKSGVMAEMLDYDDTFCALLLRQVYPGLQVKFNGQDVKLRRFFDSVSENFIEIDPDSHTELKTVMSFFEEHVSLAAENPFELEIRQKMEKTCRVLWSKYFFDSPQVLLHGDLYGRNILDAGDTYRAIDAYGLIGPPEFEFTRMYLIESADEKPTTLDGFKERFKFFKPYGVSEKLNAALYIDMVSLLDEWVYTRDDNYQNVAWSIEVIKKLFYTDEELKLDELPMPHLFV